MAASDEPYLDEQFLPDEQDGTFTPAARIREIEAADVLECLHLGWRDFRSTWGYGTGFAAFYAVWGAVLITGLAILGMQFLIFPVIAGFLLLGPLVVVGLYEISRRIESGEPLELRGILLSFARHGSAQLLLFGALLVFIMIAWLKAAVIIYAFAFGLHPLGLGDLLTRGMSQPGAAIFLIVGNLIGAALAALVFAISVVGVPYLLDRDVDFITAALTSLKATWANRWPLLLWALLLGAGALGSFAIGLLGLLLFMPVAGHTTWHLYRRLLVHAD